MKIILKWMINIFILMALVTATACGPSGQKPQTEPPKPIKTEPSIEELRKPVSKDPAMFKAVNVIKEYGKLKKKAISYKKYQELTKGQSNAAFSPDWFYDSYHLDIKEKGHWIALTYGTSKKAKTQDPRVAKVMTGLPDNSISMKLKTPSGKSYLLSDAEADGILDYAAKENAKNTKVDVKLLDQMQEKYKWVLSVIKRYYKK
ncbi:MAG: hypothetical protein GY940_02200 [bacterium]|nr:hypothetical protein [bacterium]